MSSRSPDTHPVLASIPISRACQSSPPDSAAICARLAPCLVVPPLLHALSVDPPHHSPATVPPQSHHRSRTSDSPHPEASLQAIPHPLNGYPHAKSRATENREQKALHNARHRPLDNGELIVEHNDSNSSQRRGYGKLYTLAVEEFYIINDC
ncbi:hypothetical protein AAFF_G00022660 [Aldrovandia affinis]|uniref:Uncharacterized protein n=1 Tax=Aldrovandia affinis TaxID=143900 RepID=A0AAD7T5R8_9TELE|nr:hypothetical protein AAFF_G00022660 [Aldrovandia affinis]